MKKRGFTLIELMVVIAIIGLLAAIALPRFANVSDSAKVANVQGNLSTMRTSIAMYHAKNDAYPKLATKENSLESVKNSADGETAGEAFTEFFGKSVAPETPAYNGLDTTSRNAIVASTDTGNSVTAGNKKGGWAYRLTDGAIRANISGVSNVYGDGTDWTQF